MKIIQLTLIAMLSVILFGCGHSITHTDRGTGMMARIPLPDGSSLIDLKIGKIDSTTTVLRGGASYDSIASTGGSVFGSGGTSDRIFVSTIPQLNEGYMAEVLQNGKLSDDIKKALVESYMTKAKPLAPLPSKSVSIGSAVATGSESHDLEPAAVEIDNAVNKVAEVAPKIVPPIADATTKVVDKVADTSGKMVENVSEVGIKAISATQKMVIVAIFAVILILIIAIYVYFKWFRKTSLKSAVVETAVDAIANSVTVSEEEIAKNFGKK